MGAGMASAIPVQQVRVMLEARVMPTGLEAPSRRCPGSRAVGGVLTCVGPPGRVRAVGPLRVEAGRRAAEGAAAAAEARGGPAAGGAGRRVRRVAAARCWRGAAVRAREVAVVLGPVRRRAQRVVGFRDLHKLRACVRVGWVAVRVVLLRERVELRFDFGLAG